MANVPWTYLTIAGVTIFRRHARDIKVSRSKVKAGGDLVRLASGVRKSLRRVQFGKKDIVTISGSAARKPAIDHLEIGDTIVVGLPGWIDLPGDVADANLRHVPQAGSVKRIAEIDGRVVELPHGDARIVCTAYRPTMTIMVDDVNVDDEDQAAKTSWSITSEMV